MCDHDLPHGGAQETESEGNRSWNRGGGEDLGELG